MGNGRKDTHFLIKIKTPNLFLLFSGVYATISESTLVFWDVNAATLDANRESRSCLNLLLCFRMGAPKLSLSWGGWEAQWTSSEGFPADTIINTYAPPGPRVRTTAQFLEPLLRQKRDKRWKANDLGGGVLCRHLVDTSRNTSQNVT